MRAVLPTVASNNMYMVRRVRVAAGTSALERHLCAHDRHVTNVVVPSSGDRVCSSLYVRWLPLWHVNIVDVTRREVSIAFSSSRAW
jgi:hypothetical protein